MVSYPRESFIELYTRTHVSKLCCGMLKSSMSNGSCCKWILVFMVMNKGVFGISVNIPILGCKRVEWLWKRLLMLCQRFLESFV